MGKRGAIDKAGKVAHPRDASIFARAQIDAVFGSLRFDGKAKSIEDMNAAVVAEARRRATD